MDNQIALIAGEGSLPVVIASRLTDNCNPPVVYSIRESIGELSKYALDVINITKPDFGFTIKDMKKRGVKSTTVKVTDPKTGKTVEKNLSASEMNKRRLEYARKLDEERYKDERTVPLSELENKKED